MYSNESILALETRIGWEKPLNSQFGIDLSEGNLTANSGRKVNMFHQLVTVENVYSAVSEIDMELVKFNEFLSSIRKQCTNEVVINIIDKSELYNASIDYSQTILDKKALFDDAIGYCIAIKMLELFISSSRSNLQERNAKLSFQSLKLELEGVKNDNGIVMAQGIQSKYEIAIKTAKKIIFPKTISVQSGKSW